MGRRWRMLPASKRNLVIRLAARGLSYREILEEAHVTQGSIGRVLRPLGGIVRAGSWEVPAGRLTLEDRIEIRLGLERGETYAVIGAMVDRHSSTVCREVNLNGGRSRYRPMTAHRRAIVSSERPKPTKLAASPLLLARVSADLEALLSPEQIAACLKLEFRDDPGMQISHETIYKSLFVQGRGELRRELARCLRTGRAVRQHRKQTGERRGRLAGMVMISERPAEIEDRAVPGHWEGDLIIGKNGKSAIGTLVERSTRYVLLLHLPIDRSADQVNQAMTTAIMALPETLRRSVTWDQGSEMADHQRFTIDTGIQIYFCDPHSPWQRGTNENTNGLLRQYFPKGTDLSLHDAAALQKAADSLNSRPRKTLRWQTPTQQLTKLVVAITD